MDIHYLDITKRKGVISMNNLFIKCMFHDKNYNIKPSKNEIGYIQKNIKETTIALNDLANELCHGATFKPGVLVEE